MGKDIHVDDTGSNKAEGTGSGGAKSTSTTETKSRGRGRTGSGGTGGRGQQTEEEKLPKLVPVDVPGKEEEKAEIDAKLEEKRKKDRERKARSRANAKSSPRSKGKTKAPSMEILQLKPILMTVSTMVASREGFEIWALSEAEINTLCEPIENMLAKTSALEKVGENSDAIALAIACFTIFIPKFLMWNSTRKQKKAQVVTNYARPNPTTGTSGRNETGKTGTSPKPSGGEATVSSQNFSGDIASLIPASAPF